MFWVDKELIVVSSYVICAVYGRLLISHVAKSLNLAYLFECAW